MESMYHSTACDHADREQKQQTAPALTVIGPWEATFSAVALPAIVLCLKRIRSWRPPPNWSAIDWCEEAKEVLSVAAWQAELGFDPCRRVPFSAFLYQRGMSRVLTRYRQEWSYGLRFLSAPPESSLGDEAARNGPASAHSPSGTLETTETSSAAEDWPKREALAEAVAALPDTNRRIILLLFWEELTEAEIATRLGISQQAVSARKHRILREFRSRIAMSRWRESARDNGKISKF